MFQTNPYQSILFVALLLLLLTNSGLWAQENSDSDKWTPKDIINTQYVRSLHFSPNGKMVVWTKRKSLKKEDKFVNDIYLTRLDLQKGGKFRTFQLTRGKFSDASPVFSRDNETIYFLSSREKGKKLWAMSIFGGEPEEVHSFENGISNLQWLNDHTLTFTSNDGKTLHEKKAEKIKDNTVVVEDSVHWKISKVYAFNLKDKTVNRLIDNRFPVSAYAVSKDGKYMVTAHTMSRHYASDGQPAPKYYLRNLENKEQTEILKGLQTPSRFRFTSDNRGFYFTAIKSSDPEWQGAGISELYYFDLTDKQHRKVNLNWENGIGSGFYLAGNQLIVSLANGATNTLAYYLLTDGKLEKQELDFGSKTNHISILNCSEDGKKLVYVYATGSRLPEYAIADITTGRRKMQISNPRELVTLNQHLRKKHMTKSEVFRWIGAKDEEVNGILYYPENYESGKKYPLILSIHGGPAGVSMDSWSQNWSSYPSIYAQKGAFVLKPNYHGSSNHGQAFVESIKHHYYDLEMVDIVNGIEALNKKGMIDMDKLGVMGWSNGAILTTMLTLRYPDMFKAAAPGAGDVNWTSDFGTCRFGVQFDQSYFGGAPWDDKDGKNYNETYITKSPLFDMEKIKTPTIIFHGSEDRAVPRDQGWEYYRAMQQVGKAPVRFLWFPGQPHGLQKVTHQLRKMNEEIAWFDRFLFKTFKPENETFNEESPLAMVLEIDKASTSGGFYGVQKKGALLPEMVTVKKDSIAISKFELTNSQFKAFKPEHEFEPGKGNYPIKGLDKKTILSYLEWLGEKTGSKYRLPNPSEAKKLHTSAHKSGAKENTLNYWAGYEITRDEVDLFYKKVEEVKSELVKAVGSFKATRIGEGKVYDLGGNVAEYYLDRNELKTYGYSAYDYVDPVRKEVQPKEENIGFRVVQEL